MKECVFNRWYGSFGFILFEKPSGIYLTKSKITVNYFSVDIKCQVKGLLSNGSLESADDDINCKFFYPMVSGLMPFSPINFKFDVNQKDRTLKIENLITNYWIKIHGIKKKTTIGCFGNYYKLTIL